jgi:hypothetical protein
MKYQIVGTDQSGVKIILDSFDHLEIATKSFDLIVMLAKVPNRMPFSEPEWISIELQRVESISSSRIDP